MANALTALDRGRPSSLARHRQGSGLLDAARKGLPPSFAVVTYKGRQFRVKYRTEEHIVRDDRGRAAGYIDVVVVGVSPNISRQYFARAYTEGDSEGPDCYATDGIKPDAAAPHKQNAVCSTCKWSQWGSRVTDGGKRAKACQETRRIAVVPLANIENELMGGPMLLRIPPMSLLNLSNYSDFLATKGASFEVVATRIGFDENVAYPRLTFETLDWLTDEQQLLVTGEHGDGGVCASPLIDRMLSSSDAPATAAAEPRSPHDHPYPEPGPSRQPAVQEPDDDNGEEYQEEDDDEEEAPPPPREQPRGAVNPFAAEVTPLRPEPEKVTAATIAATPGGRQRGRPRKTAGNGQTTSLPAPAEVDLESALDKLLGDPT